MSLWSKIGEFLGALIQAAKDPLPPEKPKWLEIAQSQLGVAEIPGLKHSDAVLAYHATTMLKATTDEVPWCSSFVNWCMTKAGIRGTNSAAARSWLKWGVETKPLVGAVAVLSRGSNPASGHVGFFYGFASGNRVVLLGGNQGNKVSTQTFQASRVLGYRWPKEVP